MGETTAVTGQGNTNSNETNSLSFPWPAGLFCFMAGRRFAEEKTCHVVLRLEVTAHH